MSNAVLPNASTSETISILNPASVHSKQQSGADDSNDGSLGSWSILERILFGLAVGCSAAFGISFIVFGYAAILDKHELFRSSLTWLPLTGLLFLAQIAALAIFSKTRA